MNKNIPKSYTKEDNFLKAYDVANKSFLSILGSDEFPVELKSQLNSILQDVSIGKNIVDLYPEILAEIPISSSCFQDKCVQYEEHFTPHRKLRQAMLEMQNKLNALDTAKNGYKKTVGKLEKVNSDISNIKTIIDKIKNCDDPSILIKACFYLPSNISTTISSLVVNSNNNVKVLGYLGEYSDIIINELNSVLWEKSIERDELIRGLNSTEHMVKDAVIKVAQQKNLVSEYTKEVEKSGLSFEESEVIYYVMYFASECEKQYATMGRMDTGTYGVIKQLPYGLRRKVLDNAKFIKNLAIEGTDDYITIEHRDRLLPKRTPDGRFEGVNVKDFLGVDFINTLSKRNSENED